MSGRRKGGRRHGPTLPAALLRLVGRRFRTEYLGTPFYRMALGGPRATGIAISPRDFRPVDMEIGRQIMLGRMVLAGVALDMGVSGDPWDTPSPTRAFAVELHRFAWLPSLIAQGQEGAEEALRLVLDWRRLFGRFSPFVWSAEATERRVYNLACGVRRLTELASDAEAAELIDTLSRQARHLFAEDAGLLQDAGPLRRAERMAVTALAATTLAGKAGQRLGGPALKKLSRALAVTVLPDGGVKSRRPEQALELLFDLLALDDALLQRGREAPAVASRSIDRLTVAVRFFTLGDGRLGAFQGGEAAAPRQIAAALAHDDEGRAEYNVLPHSGYHHLAGKNLLVMADAAVPAQGAWSLNACAQPLAIEITCGGDRLIANTGWSPDAHGSAALRLTDGGSTASLGGGSVGQPLSGLRARAFGPRLVGGAEAVSANRHESDAGIWLELSHDGWADSIGLIHQRRLFLDPGLDELRGEDLFQPAGGASPRRRSPAYAVRFHLPPEVQVSLARDKRSVLLRGPSNRGWWFRNDAPDVLLEASTIFEDRAPKRAAQIVLKGPLGPDGARVRWKLTPVEPNDPHAPVKVRTEQVASRASGSQAAL